MVDDTIEYPETYANCCYIPHWICSIIICVVFIVTALVALIIVLAYPEGFIRWYHIEADTTNIRIGGTVVGAVILFACSLLAYGIANDKALSLLTWVILVILIWKMHLILFVIGLLQLLMNQEGYWIHDWMVLGFLLVVQVVWLILIIMVGRHWYAICEETYAQTQDYGPIPGARGQRKLLMSNRSRLDYLASVRSRRQRDETYDIYNRYYIP